MLNNDFDEKNQPVPTQTYKHSPLMPAFFVGHANESGPFRGLDAISIISERPPLQYNQDIITDYSF